MPCVEWKTAYTEQAMRPCCEWVMPYDEQAMPFDGKVVSASRGRTMLAFGGWVTQNSEQEIDAMWQEGAVGG